MFRPILHLELCEQLLSRGSSSESNDTIGSISGDQGTLSAIFSVASFEIHSGISFLTDKNELVVEIRHKL